MGDGASSAKEISLSRATLLLTTFSFLLLLAYVPTVDAPFIFDDEVDLVGNSVLGTFWPPEWLGLTRRPFATLTFALNFALFGESSFGLRAVNIAIHLTSFFAAYALLAKLSDAPRSPTSLRTLAPIIAGVWALHPLHTSAVTYVVHRYESLAGTLYLLALFSFFRARELASGPRIAAFVVSTTLAGLTKETAITIPVVALFLERGLYDGSLREILRDRFRAYALLAVSLLPLVVLVFVIPQGASQRFDNALFGPKEYALSEPSALAHYARLALWPHPLSIDYYDWPVVSRLGDLGIPALVTIACVVFGVVSGFAGRAWALPFLLALVHLAPTSSVIPLRYEIVAERRMYLPLLPLVAFSATLLWEGARKLEPTPLRKSFLWVVASLVSLALTGVTLARNTDYLDPIEFYENEVTTRPSNARSHAWLGQYLARAKEFDRAYSELTLAKRLDPAVPLLERQLAFVAHTLGKYEEAAAEARLSLSRHPNDAESYFALALTLPRAGQAVELVDRLNERARTGNLEAFLADPLVYHLATVPERRDGTRALALSEDLLRNLGPSPRLLELRALALGALGRFDEALAQLARLDAENPRIEKERAAFSAKRAFDYREEWDDGFR